MVQHNIASMQILRHLSNCGPIILTFAISLFFGVAVALASLSPAAAAAIPKPEIKRLIITEAEQSTHVTPSLALAVAHVESRFQSDAVSPKGAIGVMQIMPRTGRDVFGLTSEQLRDPRTNIRAGIAFLDQLIVQYGGRIDLALSHYNGGSAVSRNGTQQIIPYTRGYVLKVLAAAQKYSAEAPPMGKVERRTPPVTMPAIHADSRLPNPSSTLANYQQGGTRNTSVAAHLEEVDFWLQTAEMVQVSPLNNLSPSPSQRLIEQMEANRRQFRNWLRQHQ